MFTQHLCNVPFALKFQNIGVVLLAYVIDDIYCLRVEEGCTCTEVPFHLLSGESVEYLASLEGAELVCLTNYRLLATHRDYVYSVRSPMFYVYFILYYCVRILCECTLLM